MIDQIDSPQLSLFQWPPPYTVHKHPRAKRVNFRVCPSKGLQITLPKRMSVKHVPQLIEENRRWIERHMPTILRAHQPRPLPTMLLLPAITQTYTIQYIDAAHPVRLSSRADNSIILRGDIADTDRCRTALSNWIKRLAKRELTAWTDRLCRSTGLQYQQLTVRFQKTQWGSCSAENNISLNAALLFLPADHVEHVIIHELCHTQFHNHSRNFWRLVASFDPEWKRLRKAVKHATHVVPPWLD